jgi:ribosomal protein S18 acetylase RimI-like enzyme
MGQQVSSYSSGIIRLTKADIKGAAEVLARAFHNYPLSVYFEQNEDKRRKTSPRIYRTMINHGLKYGEVYATSVKIEGVAIWFPYHTPHDTWWSNFFSGRFLVPFFVGMATMRRQQAFGAYATGVRKRVAPFPHWYLQVLGIDPDYQGQGLASRLVKPMFERLDTEGMPCFLETQAAENVTLYEHLGFRVAEEGTIPGSDIKSWAMLRGKID